MKVSERSKRFSKIRKKSKRSRGSNIRKRSKRSRGGTMRKSRIKRSRGSRRSKRTRRIKMRKSKRSRRSKLRRSKRSRRSKLRKSKRSNKKSREVNDLDKIFYNLNKFQGLDKEISKFLKPRDLRRILNYEKFEELNNEYIELFERKQSINTELYIVKKAMKKTKRHLDYMNSYIMYGDFPPRTKEYSYIKKLK